MTPRRAAAGPRRAAAVALVAAVAGGVAHAQPAPDAVPPEHTTAADAADAAGDPAAGDDEDAADAIARDTGDLGRFRQALEVDDCPVAPALSDDELRALASEHYGRGEVLYNERGDFEAAIRELVAAYCLVPFYTVLKDIGQAYERTLEFERAIAYLERYVAEVPDDAPGADDKRRSVSARAQVLRTLPASVQVTTTPPGALVSFTDDRGVRQASGRARDEPFRLLAGRYTMTVELPGYEPQRAAIEPRIGKPYSYYFPLRPEHGQVMITAVPGDARIFVDQRLVGIGRYLDRLPGGVYEVTVEASGRRTETRRVEVSAARPLDLAVSLPPRPQSGRTQLLVASAIGGGLVGSVALGVLEDDLAAGGLGLLGGTGVGLLGGWFAIPDDIEVGPSSYIISSSLIGAAEASLIASLLVDSDLEGDGGTIATAGIGGLAAGATFGALTAERFHLDAGDAALLNSGALWGGVAGALFAVIFEAENQVSEGVVLGGLNLGILAGVLVGQQVDYSRRHVALIDLSGLAGMGIAVSLQSAIDGQTNSDADSERPAHFALGGLVIGLGVGALLTQDMDVPKLGRVAPVMSGGKDAAGADVRFVGLRGEL